MGLHQDEIVGWEPAAVVSVGAVLVASATMTTIVVAVRVSVLISVNTVVVIIVVDTSAFSVVSSGVASAGVKLLCKRSTQALIAHEKVLAVVWPVILRDVENRHLNVCVHYLAP
jgi:hypothetical protein